MRSIWLDIWPNSLWDEVEPNEKKEWPVILTEQAWSIGFILWQNYRGFDSQWFIVLLFSVLRVGRSPSQEVGGYSHTLPIRVWAAQRGRDFEAPDLEWGQYPFQRRFLERGIFRTRESSSFVSNHLKLFKDTLLLKIRFNALTSKLSYSCCTLERSIKNWHISRTGYQF